MKNCVAFLALGMFLLAGLPAHAGIAVLVDHNGNDDATPQFKFRQVPSPLAGDTAAAATFSLVDGEKDPNSGGVDRLNDGRLPNAEDEPDQNFFFDSGTAGGRLQVDLGRIISVRQVNSYSWHPGTRGPQVYKLYASDGATAGFNGTPKNETDPESCGWKLIANVNTKLGNESGGGQYGVSIFDPAGSIGRFRYLLFDIASTESHDAFGNTFYSEIDVLDANAPEMVRAADESSESPAPFIIKTADGKCAITFKTDQAPELKTWAEASLAPVLADWYPKIAGMLASDDFTAPDRFTVTIKPMNGVAFTLGTSVVVSADWVKNAINTEAIGSVIHEGVHVVQQYGSNGYTGRAPGWLVEGIADYVRWFKFEPQSHGADTAWIRKQGANYSPNYDGSYRITANFLDWVSKKYDTEIVGQLNAALRAGEYEAGLWKKFTGKTVQELGAEWREQIEAQIASGNASQP